jgi:tripartite-type tricarboxylate transporter receptor subunit TctC
MTPATARGAAVIVLLSAAFTAAHAQPFPTRPIRLISPYPPGGGNDVLARLIADKMGEGLGQRVIVDNRAGANTIVGTEIVAKSAPDGHTLVLVPNSFVTNVGFYAKLPYDTVRDFAPVALVALSPQMLVVHPAVPATYGEGADRARQSQARLLQLRQFGQRFGRPSRDGIVRHDGRHQD